MAFFPKLNIIYNSIPSTGSDYIHRRLISHEMFDGVEQDDSVYNNIIYQSKYIKNKDFVHMPNWEYNVLYPDSFDSYQFSVVRNPYDRVISMFFDLTKTNKDYAKYIPKNKDSIKDLQDKFEKFFVYFKMFKNFNQGIGIEHIEILLHELDYPQKEKMSNIFRKNKFFTDTRLGTQFELIRSDFRQRYRFFGKPSTHNFNRVKIIKYENMRTGLSSINDKIFSNFSYPRNSIKSSSQFDYPTNYFFNKRSLLLVSEYYEQDFYLYHYVPNLKII